MSSSARIYLRRSSDFGSSCDGCADTGHHITDDSGRFTVYMIDGSDEPIIRDATREQAEAAIAEDWRRA